MKRSLYILVFICLLAACKNTDSNSEKFVVQPRDTTITVRNSYNDLFLDSVRMETFISKEAIADSLADRIRSFYNSRNYQLAWFDSSGLAEYAYSFLHLQNQYIEYARDSSIFDPALRQLQDSLETDSTNYHITGDAAIKTELLLTESFFRYALKAYQGSSRLNEKDLGWFIPRKKIDMTGLLDSMINNKGKDLSSYEPVNRQYNLLKEQLLHYYELEKQGKWDSIAITKKFYKKGEHSPTLAAIKERLFLIGDLAERDTTDVFDSTLEIAVKHFQRRYGLKEDGAIGTSLLKELNRPVGERIQQLLVNMERIRWMPAQTPDDYLLVNIPAYQLFVYEGGKLNFKMNVVVGSAAHNTVIFRGDMKYIVFSPYWNVTPSIIKNEIMPGIKRDKNYLAKHNMEWNNGAVRQKPGPANSLGLVKFLFPNSYNIYLHDTPSKGLFNETNRAFSHGCIRLSQPRKLAEYLLRKDSSWTAEKMTAAMNAGKEKWVTLSPSIPVYIGYFTAWVDTDGLLNFRDDIYGHDKKIAEKLFLEDRK